ncbi:DUF6479 family protein [Streptomyces mangrovisoli]|uniref:Uncharacterized protein n=1 Tax=Streptomyces mangrovisoli TaxID=1428628 RepID=A0A1J4P3T9_9ACTN|nr:DUF6479 family protein [Streptomyces mangrovisoli]OIJ68882.1 hypothetical protein WN71_005305 [Streptomyces mangrovisoli]
MDTTRYEAASAGTALGLVAVLIGGLVVAGALVWAVRFGIGVRRSESPAPGPGDQPSPPASGPVHETREMREPDEVPRAQDGSERLTPHQLNPSGTRPAAEQRRRRWG